jgi:two-component system response regulator AtoC
VAINCGAIPDTLIESELFGHAKGAFTDARQAKRGLLTEADGGTLLLDEVGELPASAQVKLLRFLQEGEVRPVGETRAEKVDVRIVAATNRDLARRVEKELFREDLYFRLNVFSLVVPPLRERREDVLALAREFLARFCVSFNHDPRITGFTAEAEALLLAWRWPGNVRELLNVVERAVLLCDGTEVQPANLPERLWSPPAPLAPATSSAPTLPSPEAMAFSLKRAQHTVEDIFIRAALRKTKGNRTRAAELLEISHRALLYKLKDYGIDPDAEGERG